VDYCKTSITYTLPVFLKVFFSGYVPVSASGLIVEVEWLAPLPRVGECPRPLILAEVLS
jgi:hypothetical protein